jgi:hypothetical protein
MFVFFAAATAAFFKFVNHLVEPLALLGRQHLLNALARVFPQIFYLKSHIFPDVMVLRKGFVNDQPRLL